MTWWRKLTWPRRTAVAASWVLSLPLVGLAFALMPAVALIALVTVLAGRVIVLAVMSAYKRR